KPVKPYPDFPHFAHAAGVWATKIRGKLHSFGPWGDPDGALTKYLAEKDPFHAGRKPRAGTEGLIVKDARAAGGSVPTGLHVHQRREQAGRTARTGRIQTLGRARRCAGDGHPRV